MDSHWINIIHTLIVCDISLACINWVNEAFFMCVKICDFFLCIQLHLQRNFLSSAITAHQTIASRKFLNEKKNYFFCRSSTRTKLSQPISVGIYIFFWKNKISDVLFVWSKVNLFKINHCAKQCFFFKFQFETRKKISWPVHLFFFCFVFANLFSETGSVIVLSVQLYVAATSFFCIQF